MWMMLGKDWQHNGVCAGDWKILSLEVGVVLGHGQEIDLVLVGQRLWHSHSMAI